MADRYSVKAKVISQKGNCVNGHKVGDEFVIGRTTPAGICLPAFNSFFPDLRVLMFGGVSPGLMIRMPSPLPAPMRQTPLFLSCDGFARNKFSAFGEARSLFSMSQRGIFNR